MAEKRAFLETFNSLSPQMRGALVGGLVGAGSGALFGKRKNMLQNMLMFGGLGAAGGYGLSNYAANLAGDSWKKGFGAAGAIRDVGNAARDPRARTVAANTVAAPMQAVGAATANPAMSATGQIINLAANPRLPGFINNAYNNTKKEITKGKFKNLIQQYNPFGNAFGGNAPAAPTQPNQ